MKRILFLLIILTLGFAETILIPEDFGTIQAGIDAGGEEGPVHSAGLKIAFEHSWPLVDLRVDWVDKNPISHLMNLWKFYEPQSADYNSRAINPAKAPSYGVPGDE